MQELKQITTENINYVFNKVVESSRLDVKGMFDLGASLEYRVKGTDTWKPSKKPTWSWDTHDYRIMGEITAEAAGMITESMGELFEELIEDGFAVVLLSPQLAETLERGFPDTEDALGDEDENEDCYCDDEDDEECDGDCACCGCCDDEEEEEGNSLGVAYLDYSVEDFGELFDHVMDIADKIGLDRIKHVKVDIKFIG